jgi:hypothetical protein
LEPSPHRVVALLAGGDKPDVGLLFQIVPWSVRCNTRHVRFTSLDTWNERFQGFLLQL